MQLIWRRVAYPVILLTSEVGGVVPKHEAPYREFNVAAAVRDVSCVTCRACDVARDRSMARDSTRVSDLEKIFLVSRPIWGKRPPAAAAAASSPPAGPWAVWTWRCSFIGFC